jgi:hypothetical protein
MHMSLGAGGISQGKDVFREFSGSLEN